MPADRDFTIHPGRSGINFRDDPAALGADELSDSLNWRISARGSIVKRNGISAYSVDTPAAIIRLGVYAPFNAGPFVIAYCTDGTIQQTDDGQAWTQIAGGLTPSSPSFAQYKDKLYVANGSDPLGEWDGTNFTQLPSVAVNDVQTITITGTPTGGSFTLTFYDVDDAAHTTGAIAFNASAVAVQSALVALDAIETGDVTCTGGALPGTPVVCTFRENLGALPFLTMTTTDSFSGGTAPASAITHTTQGESPAPIGQYLSVWRNRLWVANSEDRKVWWSAAGDPTDWHNVDTNFQSFPNQPITALAVAGQRSTSPIASSTADAGDGILVFAKNTTYRIYDDSDNVAGTITGGSNIVIDPGRGCSSSRSISTGNGRTYLVSTDGVYSTDGHAPLLIESKAINPLFAGSVISQADMEDMDGCFHEGCYYLAFAGIAAVSHDRLLELYLNLPATEDKQHPWMAHDIPATSLVSMPNGTLLFADARPGLDNRVRTAFSGSGDDDGTNLTDIVATARTGMLNFGSAGPKSIRRVVAFGYGRCAISVVSNDGTQESKTFSMPLTVDTWNPSEAWGGTWGEGGASPVRSDMAYYTRRGRYIALEITERSQNTGPPQHILGDFSGGDEGGMKITALQVTTTPLDTYA